MSIDQHCCDFNLKEFKTHETEVTQMKNNRGSAVSRSPNILFKE